MARLALVTCPQFSLTRTRISPAPYVPLGLLSIASVAEAAGHSVSIIDVNGLLNSGVLKFNRHFAASVAEYINQYGPDIVGFTTMCNSYPQTLRIAASLHDRDPNVPILLGGPQATATDLATMAAFPCVTAIVRGEAEQSLSLVLDWLQLRIGHDQLNGATIRKDGRVSRTRDSKLIADLDCLPYPAYHLYPQVTQFERLPIEAGRGCPFACTFCSTNLFFRRSYRLKSPSRLVEEMRRLRDKTGCKDFDLVHDMFTISKAKVEAICHSVIKEDLKVAWGCSARVDCVDQPLLSLMADAGCNRIFFGIETGSQRLQQSVLKKLDVDDVVPTLASLKAKGITPTASFIVGYPHETREDLLGTIKMAIRLRTAGVRSLQGHVLSPLPASPLQIQFHDRLRYSRIPSDLTWNVLQPQDKSMIRESKDIFSSFYAFPLTDNNRLTVLLSSLLIYGLRIAPLSFMLRLGKLLASYVYAFQYRKTIAAK